MFYRVEEPHGLPCDPFKAIVAPRPIGWISTVDAQGRPNLAPYSFFNAVSDDPKIVMFSSGGMKDSAKNAAETGEFTCNYVSRRIREKMNVTSGPYPHGESEFEIAGLAMVAGVTVSCRRVAGVQAALECKTLSIHNPTTLSGEKARFFMVLGEVTGIYIDDEFVVEGRFDIAKADPLMRGGYRDYATIEKLFELKRPTGGGD